MLQIKKNNKQKFKIKLNYILIKNIDSQITHFILLLSYPKLLVVTFLSKSCGVCSAIFFACSIYLSVAPLFANKLSNSLKLLRFYFIYEIAIFACYLVSWALSFNRVNTILIRRLLSLNDATRVPSFSIKLDKHFATFIFIELLRLSTFCRVFRIFDSVHA